MAETKLTALQEKLVALGCRVSRDGAGRDFIAYAPNGMIIDECLPEDAAWAKCAHYFRAALTQPETPDRG